MPAESLKGVFLSAKLPDEKVVCIVRFREEPEYATRIQQPPSVHFQVTVRADKASPSGDLIRFGQTAGDEINGWVARELMLVVDILGLLGADGQTCVPIGANDPVTGLPVPKPPRVIDAVSAA